MALGVLLAAGAVSALMLRLGLRRHITAFDGIDAALAAFERREWRGAAAAGAPRAPAVRAMGVDTGELQDLLEAAESRYQEVGRSLGPGPDGDHGQ